MSVERIPNGTHCGRVQDSTGSPLDAVLDGLEGLMRTGERQYGAKCPAHEDRKASLVVSEGDGGRVLVHCHAGCNTEDIVRELGLSMSDLFEKSAGGTSGGQQARSRIAATYDYVDEKGELLFQVVRFEPKDFRQRRPDGKGSWVWGLGSTRRVLYRLPELLGAAVGEPVFVVEGEKDVEALRAAGLVATCNPGGAGKWRPEYSTSLRGRQVAVVPDADSIGRKHAEQVASALRGIAAGVKVLELHGLPHKGDASDWLALGGTRPKLLELAATAPEFGAGSGSPPGPVGTTTTTRLKPSTGTPFREADRSASPSSEETPWPTPPDQVAYHGPAGRIARAIEPHTEADPVAVLVQTLVAFGNAAGRGPYFQVESSRHHPLLNVVLVGQTAKGRKGTSWDHVRAIFGEADPDWTHNCVGDGLSSGEGLIWAVRDPIHRKEPIKEKGRITGYQDVLADEGASEKRLLAMQPEFVHVLKVATREGNTLSATIRQAWDTGNLNVRTKTSPAKATGAHISLVGHITRSELLRYLEQTEAANGFANRFLWIGVRRSKLLPEGGGFRGVDTSELVRELGQALKFARQHGDSPIGRDKDARALWLAVYPRLSADRPGMAGAVLGRAEAQVMRLALAYALLDRSNIIAEVHLRAALALWDYAERSVLHIFGDSTGDRVADEILRSLRGAPAGMTRTDLSNHFGRHVSAYQLGRALAVLVQAGLARSTEEPSGGRPVERWFGEATGEKSEICEERSSGPSGEGGYFAKFASFAVPASATAAPATWTPANGAHEDDQTPGPSSVEEEGTL